MFAIVDEMVQSGKEPRSILESLLYKVEELTRVAYGASMPGVEPERLALLKEQASRVGREMLARAWPVLAETHAKLRTAGLPRVWLEVALLGLAEKSGRTVAMAAPAREHQAAVSHMVPSKPRKVEDAASPVKSAKTEPLSTPRRDRSPEAVALDPVWAKVLEAIAARFPSAKQTLAGSGIVEVNGRKATVEVRSRVIFERLKDTRQSTYRELVAAFREAAGDSAWSLEFQLRPPDDEMAQIPAEVPRLLEGEELERAVEQELNGERV